MEQGAYINSELGLHQFGYRPEFFTPWWASHPCFLNQVCAALGALNGVSVTQNYRLLSVFSGAMALIGV